MTRIATIYVLSGALTLLVRLLTIIGMCSAFVFTLSTAADALEINTPHVNVPTPRINVPPPRVNVPTPRVNAPSGGIPTVNVQKGKIGAGGGGNTANPSNTPATVTVTAAPSSIRSNTAPTVTVPTPHMNAPSGGIPTVHLQVNNPVEPGSPSPQQSLTESSSPQQPFQLDSGNPSPQQWPAGSVPAGDGQLNLSVPGNSGGPITVQQVQSLGNSLKNQLDSDNELSETQSLRLQMQLSGQQPTNPAGGVTPTATITYPGVYLQELTGQTHGVAGVSGVTSIYPGVVKTLQDSHLSLMQHGGNLHTPPTGTDGVSDNGAPERGFEYGQRAQYDSDQAGSPKGKRPH